MKMKTSRLSDVSLCHDLVRHQQIRTRRDLDVVVLAANDLHFVPGVLRDEIRVIADAGISVSDRCRVGLVE